MTDDDDDGPIIETRYIIIEESPWSAITKDAGMWGVALLALWLSRELFGGSLALDVVVLAAVMMSFWTLVVPYSQKRFKFSKDELRAWVALRKGPFA